jgi:hypothetical protein
MHPALYRSFQFFAAVKASLPAWAGGLPAELPPADAALMRSILRAPAQQALFNRMPPNDRRHAIAVAKTLQQDGHHKPVLLQAALLHDVAKSMGQPIPHRVAIVLLEAFWPAGLQKLSQWPGTNDELPKSDAASSTVDLQIRAIGWWRRPFVVHAHHPPIGADWAARSACDPLAVELILRHQEKLAGPPASETDHLLAALQRADNLN